MNYEYPLEPYWSQEEIVQVIHFFTQVEKAYESKVDRDDIMMAYRTFKQVVPSKSEEKQYFTEFAKQSGYSSYHVVKQARNTASGHISMSNSKTSK